MMRYEKMLTGGHLNSLGNTLEVVDNVLTKPETFDELFNCYFSHDEVVRLRVSNAMKRLCKAKKELLVPYIDRFLDEIAKIDQASTQWTLATLFDLLKKDLSPEQKKKAIAIMKENVAHHSDWIVLNTTMDVLGKWSRKDEKLGSWLIPHLERISKDERRSVSKKATKTLTILRK